MCSPIAPSSKDIVHIPHFCESVVRSCLLHDKPLKMATRCCSQSSIPFTLMSMSIVISAINIWFLCAVPCVVVPAIGVRPRLFPGLSPFSGLGWGMCQNEVRCWLAQFIIYPGIATLRLIDMPGLAQSLTNTRTPSRTTHTHTHTLYLGPVTRFICFGLSCTNRAHLCVHWYFYWHWYW